jgi:hypothetical protein
LTLVDRLGRAVRDIPLGASAPRSHTLHVETEGLTAGLYFLRLETGGGVLHQRLLVQ